MKWKNIPNLNQLNYVNWGGSIFAVFHHSIESVVVSTSQHSCGKVQCKELLWWSKPSSIIDNEEMGSSICIIKGKSWMNEQHSNESVETVKTKWAMWNWLNVLAIEKLNV